MSNAKWKMILFMLLSLRQGEVFCRVRHRLSLIEPTPLQREADAAGECVSSSLRNAKAAVKRRPPTCSHRFNYGFGTARRFSLSPTNAVNGEWSIVNGLSSAYDDRSSFTAFVYLLF